MTWISGLQVGAAGMVAVATAVAAIAAGWLANETKKLRQETTRAIRSQSVDQIRSKRLEVASELIASLQQVLYHYAPLDMGISGAPGGESSAQRSGNSEMTNYMAAVHKWGAQFAVVATAEQWEWYLQEVTPGFGALEMSCRQSARELGAQNVDQLSSYVGTIREGLHGLQELIERDERPFWT